MSDVMGVIYFMLAAYPIFMLNYFGIISEEISVMLVLIVTVLVFAIRWKQFGSDEKTVKKKGRGKQE